MRGADEEEGGKRGIWSPANKSFPHQLSYHWDTSLGSGKEMHFSVCLSVDGSENRDKQELERRERERDDVPDPRYRESSEQQRWHNAAGGTEFRLTFKWLWIGLLPAGHGSEQVSMKLWLTKSSERRNSSFRLLPFVHTCSNIDV